MNQPTVPDLRQQLFAALEWSAQVIEGVRDDQLGEPTPCTEMNVRQLLAHMVVVQEKVIGLAADRRDPFADHYLSPEAMEEFRERKCVESVDSLTPPERGRLARENLEKARAVWGEQVLDESIQLGWGPVLPGRVVAAIYLMEVLCHGWDLAHATGQPSEAPAPVAEAGLVATRQSLPAEPRGMDAGVPFGPVVESAPDAGPTEQLANWTGRVSR